MLTLEIGSSWPKGVASSASSRRSHRSSAVERVSCSASALVPAAQQKMLGASRCTCVKAERACDVSTPREEAWKNRAYLVAALVAHGRSLGRASIRAQNDAVATDDAGDGGAGLTRARHLQRQVWRRRLDRAAGPRRARQGRHARRGGRSRLGGDEHERESGEAQAGHRRYSWPSHPSSELLEHWPAVTPPPARSTAW